MQTTKKWELSDMELCCDYPILKERLTADELAYAAYLCEQHENATPNEQGEYVCGCHNPDEDGWDNNFCGTGLWLEGCNETDDFVEFVKSKYSCDGLFFVKTRIEEEELEEFLLAGGWDVYDDIDDINNRVLDSCKVSDIAYGYGFEVEDPDTMCGYVFIKEKAGELM